MTRDSAEFSAALLLGALGGAAVALALRSSVPTSRRGRARRRSLSDLGTAFAGALREQVKEASDALPAALPPARTSVGRRIDAARNGLPADPLERLRQAALGLRRLRDRGARSGR